MSKLHTDLITTRSVALLLGESIRQTIRRVERGDLKPAQKLPGLRGAYLFDRAEVDRLRRARGTNRVDSSVPISPEAVGADLSPLSGRDGA